MDNYSLYKMPNFQYRQGMPCLYGSIRDKACLVYTAEKYHINSH